MKNISVFIGYLRTYIHLETLILDKLEFLCSDSDLKLNSMDIIVEPLYSGHHWDSAVCPV